MAALTMKILAVVPARSGSKRLPGKNKLLLSGIPLIKWTLESARQVPEITDILISTDDPEIIQMCQGVDVLTPWLRGRPKPRNSLSKLVESDHIFAPHC